MAFAYTTDTVSATSVKGYSETMAGGLTLKTGTWTLTAPTTKGTIVTGLTYVLACKVNIMSGTASDEMKVKPRVDGDGVAAEGDIGILLGANNNVGTWMAIGY
jgi:hypothetical protein